MRLKVIACDAQRREIRAAAAASPHSIEVEFLPSAGGSVVALAQAAIDRSSSAPPDAFILAYALCGSPVGGLKSRVAPLIVPRPAGCEGFRADGHGICFRSTGWSESPAIQSSRTYCQSTYMTTAPGGAPSVQSGAAKFVALPPEPELFDRLVSGPWDDRSFLLVPPGWRAAGPSESSFGPEPRE